jgi:hypothetical protein
MPAGFFPIEGGPFMQLTGMLYGSKPRQLEN